MKSNALLYADETYAINRCIYDVFDSMPRYAEEALYQEALEIALTDVGIPFESQREIYPEFHGRKMAHSYRPDLICYGKIVVELKKLKFTMRMANEERIRVCASSVAARRKSGAMRKAFPHLP